MGKFLQHVHRHHKLGKPWARTPRDAPSFRFSWAKRMFLSNECLRNSNLSHVSSPCSRCQVDARKKKTNYHEACSSSHCTARKKPEVSSTRYPMEDHPSFSLFSPDTSQSPPSLPGFCHLKASDLPANLVGAFNLCFRLITLGSSLILLKSKMFSTRAAKTKRVNS